VDRRGHHHQYILECPLSHHVPIVSQNPHHLFIPAQCPNRLARIVDRRGLHHLFILACPHSHHVPIVFQNPHHLFIPAQCPIRLARIVERRGLHHLFILACHHSHHVQVVDLFRRPRSLQEPHPRCLRAPTAHNLNVRMETSQKLSVSSTQLAMSAAFMLFIQICNTLSGDSVISMRVLKL
jgi:hypothetical protein